MKTTSAVLAVALSVGVALASPSPAGAEGRVRVQAVGKCPIGAAKKASDKPVELAFWHAMPRENETTLQQLTDQFNASQNDV